MAPGSITRKILRLLYQPYKWLIFLPLFILSTCFFVGLGVIMLILFDDTVANRTTGVWWSRFNSFITPMFVTVVGREHIAKNQSYVVVANHQSNLDIFVLYGWLGVDLKWVIKKELRRVPVFGFAAEKGGNILIDRSNAKEAYDSLQKAKSKIVNGTSIMMLPEGTRSKTGQMGEFKKGAFWLARNLGLPILPVTIINTRNILPPGTLDLFPGRAVMRIHEPVDTGAYDEDSYDRLIADVKNIIGKALKDHSLPGAGAPPGETGSP